MYSLTDRKHDVAILSARLSAVNSLLASLVTEVDGLRTYVGQMEADLAHAEAEAKANAES